MLTKLRNDIENDMKVERWQFLYLHIILKLFIAQKMKFFINDFFHRCDQIRSFLRIWSHLLEKSLLENLIFCTVFDTIDFDIFYLRCINLIFLQTFYIEHLVTYLIKKILYRLTRKLLLFYIHHLNCLDGQSFETYYLVFLFLICR